jgi:hypothetical protein
MVRLSLIAVVASYERVSDDPKERCALPLERWHTLLEGVNPKEGAHTSQERFHPLSLFA